MRHSEPAPIDLCVCGHPRSEHYEYILNGYPQSRCKACDPMAGAPSGNYALEKGTYVEAMYHAADHDFSLDLERVIP